LERGYFKRSISSKESYTILLEFIKERIPDTEIPFLQEIMKFDYLSTDKSNNLPQGIERELKPGFKEKCFSFLKKESNIEEYLPGFLGRPPKEIYKEIHFEAFGFNVTKTQNETLSPGETIILFDYSKRDCVTNLYEHNIINSNKF
jgi:hypothetical protein